MSKRLHTRLERLEQQRDKPELPPLIIEENETKARQREEEWCRHHPGQLKPLVILLKREETRRTPER